MEDQNVSETLEQFDSSKWREEEQMSRALCTPR